jgi:two-component system, chemotaxis family, response regulator Rcp1
MPPPGEIRLREEENGSVMNSDEQSTVRIFLAEDNPADVYLIKRALREQGVVFELEVAENGKQALSFLQQGDRFLEERGPALILLDLNLPQHDGAEILQHIRQNRVLASVPVVVLTSSDSPRDQMVAMGSGASRYIRKPSNLEDFMAIGAALKDLLAITAEPTMPG